MRFPGTKPGGNGGVYVKSVDVDFDPNALEELTELCTPYLRDCGEIIGENIVNAVPVVDGTMRASYDPSVDESGDEVQLFPNSPFWHWLEYGTATSPVYRPVATGVERAGARFEAS